MTSLFNDFLNEIKSLQKELESLENKGIWLQSEVKQLSPFSFDAFRLKENLNDLVAGVERLKIKAEATLNQLQYLHDNYFLKQFEIDEIKRYWVRIVAKGKGIESLLQETKYELENNNLWAAISTFFDELLSELGKFIFKITKPIFETATQIIQGAKTILSLPSWNG